MDSLQDIMAKYTPPEQPELAAIKQYVADTYHTTISTAMQGESIVITVPSAALANTLRLRVQTIQDACNVTKRLIFRIG